ncbi:MAG: hypothetical protein ACOYOK_14430 [Pseudobdellovibrionaceae bacterium]
MIGSINLPTYLNCELDRYFLSIDYIESNQLDKASEVISYFRDALKSSQSQDLEILRRLLSVRLQLKNGQLISQIDSFIRPEDTKEFTVKAESYFVLGLHAFHQSDFFLGSKYFNAASKLYPRDKYIDRIALCMFNEYSGSVNTDRLSLSDEENHIQILESFCRKHRTEFVLALVLRQKSYLLEDQNKNSGALISINESAEMFNSLGRISDYHLALLQSANLHLKLNEKRLAKAKLELIIGYQDQRVAFAYDFLMALMNGELLPNVNNYSIVSPRWKKRYQEYLQSKDEKQQKKQDIILWKKDSGILFSQGKSISSLRRGSLEAQVFNYLVLGRKSQTLLCSLLWPEQSYNEQLVNRLHKVLTRLKKKTGPIIQFEQGVYFLTKNVIAASAQTEVANPI